MHQKIKKKSNYIELLILLSLFGNLIFPSVRIGIGVNVITFGSIFLILYLFTKLQKITIDRISLGYVEIIFFMIISLLSGYAFLNVRSGYQDWMEIFRYFQILPFFIAIGFLDERIFFSRFRQIALYSSGVMIFVTLMQLTNIFGIGDFLNNIYAAETQLDNLSREGTRLILTGSDPNVGAVAASILSMYFGIFFLENRGKINIALCVCLFFGVLLTQSRTVVAAYFFSAIFYVSFFANVKIISKLLMIALLLAAIFYVIFYSNFDYIVIGVESALVGNDMSVNIRIENYLDALEAMYKSPFFGYGPSKYSYSAIFDAEYALVLYRYGIVGLFVLIYWYLSRLFFAIKYLKKSHNKEYSWVAKYMISLVPFVLIVMVTNNILAGYQTVAVTALLGVSGGMLGRSARIKK